MILNRGFYESLTIKEEYYLQTERTMYKITLEPIEEIQDKDVSNLNPITLYELMEILEAKDDHQ